jgi:hypothetical protein
MHKLIVADERPPHQAPKSRKDRLQAAMVLEALVEDRPGDLSRAWEAIRARRWMRRVERGLSSLDPALARRARALA